MDTSSTVVARRLKPFSHPNSWPMHNIKMQKTGHKEPPVRKMFLPASDLGVRRISIRLKLFDVLGCEILTCDAEPILRA